MRKILAVLTSLALAPTLPARAQAAKPTAVSFDAGAFYRLTNEWQGPCRSLDVINDGRNDQVALRKTADLTGQLWRITTEGGSFRLTTQWLGPGRSLGVKNGRTATPVLAATANVPGQRWKIVPLDDGSYHLTPERQPGKSLGIGNDDRNDRPALALTRNVPGQRWRITKETAVGPVPSALGLDPFYKKYLDGDGIPIVSSEKVSDGALLQAQFLARQMLVRLPAVREELKRRNVRIAVMAPTEVTTDIPEHAFLKADTTENWDQYRGLGATETAPVSSCAQENLLCEPDTHYPNEDIFIHEFAHTLHKLGLVFTDPGFQAQLDAAYHDAVVVKGLWARTYAGTNSEEYWAEGVQDWFDVNDEADPPNGIHNQVNTRAELATYDPRLHALIAAYFPADRNECSCH